MNLPLGFITTENRTAEQHDAHAGAEAQQLSFVLPQANLPKGTKIMLTDFWKDRRVIDDIGFEFNGFWQQTGCCVGVSAGNAVFTLSAIQRCLADDPTKAFVPWWPFNYGRTRFNEGDRGQGEGAVVSVMLDTLKAGVFAENQKELATDLPDFKRTDDGLTLTKQVEMLWSDGKRIDPDLVTLAKQFPVGSITKVNDCDAIEAAIANGYPVNDGCDLFIQHGTVKGSGDEACVMGKYDGHGGHATCILGVWIHPRFGRLFLYSNQWPTQVYPDDPAGAGRCCVWVPESEVDLAFRRYGMSGQAGALSHLDYMPAQIDKLMNWKQYT